MTDPRPPTRRYHRNRFTTRLPSDRRYTRSHFWLLEEPEGRWRIGLTAFATRMLGEIVEYDLEPEVGASVRAGDIIGWIEGFKAISDLYCVAGGTFEGANPASSEATDSICAEPYGRGWLYAVRGAPAGDAMDVDAYIAWLDATIDRLEARPWSAGEPSDRE